VEDFGALSVTNQYPIGGRVKAAGHGTPMMGERESYSSFQWEAMRHDSISAGDREAWPAIDASAKVSSLERRKGSRSGLGRRSEWAD
jgi:hypothetical protein